MKLREASVGETVTLSRQLILEEARELLPEDAVAPFLTGEGVEIEVPDEATAKRLRRLYQDARRFSEQHGRLL